jgi:hypothetical protein
MDDGEGILAMIRWLVAKLRICPHCWRHRVPDYTPTGMCLGCWMEKKRREPQIDWQ